MTIPPPDISWFAETFSQASLIIIEAWEDTGLEHSTTEPSPEMLSGAMEQLIELLKVKGGVTPPAPAADDGPGNTDISELGHYGISILEEFALMSDDLALSDSHKTWELLAVSLTRWLAANGAEITSLDLVVNGFAFIANRSASREELEILFMAMSEITEAMAPVESHPGDDREELPQSEEMLLLNRGIVATRTHSPNLMETAFSDIVRLIPEKAPRFFQEGMEQLELINYPDQVREVIQRYAGDWPEQRTLH